MPFCLFDPMPSTSVSTAFHRTQYASIVKISCSRAQGLDHVYNSLRIQSLFSLAIIEVHVLHSVLFNAVELTGSGSHVSGRRLVRPRLGINHSLLQSLTVVRWPSPDGSPRHPRDPQLLGPRCTVCLLSLAFVHLSASTPASSLLSGPVLRSPHVSRIGYYLIDDVRSDGVHLSSLNLAARYHTGSRIDDSLDFPQVASH